MNRISFACCIIFALLLTGCFTDHAHESDHAGHDQASAATSRTIWTHQLEAFVEVDTPIAGRDTPVLIHLTELDDFTALDTRHIVRMEFVAEGSAQLVTNQAVWLRPGICKATLSHPTPATGTLTLQVEGAAELLHVDLGRIVVGTEAEPGGFLPMPTHQHDMEAPVAAHAHDSGLETGEHEHGHEVETETGGQRFTKEQQWDMDFQTAPAISGSLPTGITVYGRIQARSGYDIILTAPVDGIVTAAQWPTAGMSTETGQVLFRLTPKVSGDFSLTGLNATVQELKAEEELVESRLDRLEKLLENGTVSRWEVEDARVRVATLQNRLSAAKSDLQTARSMRERTGERREQLDVRSPLSGSITHVRVTPGKFVTAGTELIHLVRERPIQLELAVPTQQSHVLSLPATGLYLKSFTDREPVYIGPEDMRMLAHTPGVDPETGKITLYIEINRSLNRYPLHAMVEAELLFSDSVEGVVIPVSALVDDAGSFVVYRQLSGERFARTPVHIVHRTGDRILVTGLEPGTRVVTQGAQTLRRAEMVGSGSFQDHGHSH